MTNRNEELDPDQQEANAHAQALAQLSKSSGNNTVYLVRIEDPEAKPKIRRFIALRKPLMEVNSVTFQAYEMLEKVERQKVNNREDALAYAQEHMVKFFDITCPWQRVVSIENLSYQTKLKSKQ